MKGFEILAAVCLLYLTVSVEALLCHSSCQTCSTTSSTGCLTCRTGYVKTPSASPSSCFLSSSSSITLTNSSHTCPPGFGKVGSSSDTICRSLSYIENIKYYYPSKSNLVGGTSTSCIPNFYYYSAFSKCVVCLTNCATCSMTTTCLTCDAGYTKDFLSTSCY